MAQPAVARDARSAAAIPVQPAAADGAVERAVSRRPARADADAPRSALNGIAAPISSTASATAAPATRERDALGAERGGSAYLGGAVLQGWEAPALTALSRAPVPWTEDAARALPARGHTPLHGMAGGPMAPVVRGLAAVPVDDVRAIAHYLVSCNPIVRRSAQRRRRDVPSRAAASKPRLLRGPAQRMFESACGACHHDGDGPELLGRQHAAGTEHQPAQRAPRQPAAHDPRRHAGSGVHRDRPHAGVSRRARRCADRRTRGLHAPRFAPQEPPWSDLPQSVARVRASSAAATAR